MAVPVERGPAVRGAPPRIINVILGVWLFISAFIWPHTQAQMTNTWICGVLVVIFALVSMAVPWVRYLNTLLAIWLFISAWALPTAHAGTIWNNVLVAIAVFIVSLVPNATTATGAPGFLGGRTAPPRAV
ncbi:MAG TPA: SPW repeat protein [Polyangiaceae bacterium]|nr:SPW repeat protein [Polyangiaceae bacterium]